MIALKYDEQTETSFTCGCVCFFQFNPLGKYLFPMRAIVFPFFYRINTMNITLNENNLSDQFNGWVGILETFSSTAEVEEETWELIREYSYQHLPVYENVYQDVLLNKIKQNIEEGTPLLEMGYSINIYINARDSSLSITKDFGDGSWDINDKVSLNEALSDISDIESEN